MTAAQLLGDGGGRGLPSAIEGSCGGGTDDQALVGPPYSSVVARSGRDGLRGDGGSEELVVVMEMSEAVESFRSRGLTMGEGGTGPSVFVVAWTEAPSSSSSSSASVGKETAEAEQRGLRENSCSLPSGWVVGPKTGVLDAD